MQYQYLALLAAFLIAATILTVKYISKHIISDPHSLFFWTYVSGLPFILLIPLFHGWYFSWPFLLPMIIHSVLLTSGQYLISKGIYLVDASVVSPLFQLQSGFIIILATIFLREKYQPIIYLYLILLVVGAWLVSMTDKVKIKAFFQTGVLYIIGMQLFHAAANIAIGFALKYTSSWQTVFYSFLLNSVLVSAYIMIKRVPVTWEFKKIRWMFFRAFLLFTGTALLYKAFETNVSVSSTIGLLSSPLVFVISVALAILYPNFLEKQSPKTYAIRSIGMLMILFGTWNIMLLK